MPTPDLAELADPDKAQYFLTSPSKIAALLGAAGILPTDDVAEAGLLVNLPTRVAESLLQELAGLDFRTAVLAVDEHTDTNGLEGLDVTEVTTITGQDFTPAQPSVSRLARVTRHPPMSPNVSVRPTPACL